ncbi:hypothetical protein B0I35DRAFT_179231 [Stachybotrys elegans]|uniref:Nucleoside phosphorylase domain-containing protein n=1 Tax=Stachybotrys elegans TaxID=80388 RepID=A0A8K0WJI0_9HYPO|nr:hypothetical protein B0I35DRAFT_179231 [Stachybotrys elegans]
MATRPLTGSDIKIAIICEVPELYEALCVISERLPEVAVEDFPAADSIPFLYRCCRIGNHNVCLAGLTGVDKVFIGPSVSQLGSAFNNLRLIFLVGICGGVPYHDGQDILLGDVVIADNVIEYDDFELSEATRVFKPRDEHPISLINRLKTSAGRESVERSMIGTLVEIQYRTSDIFRSSAWAYPGTKQDRLFVPDYSHKHHGIVECGCDDQHICQKASVSNCEQIPCNELLTITRKRLLMKRMSEANENTVEAQAPKITIGSVCYTNNPPASGEGRDVICEKTGAIAFNYAAVPIWRSLPCLVVKGICDYSDGHGNVKWHHFAMATAASAVTALLDLVPNTFDSIEADRPLQNSSDPGHLMEKQPTEIGDSGYGTAPQPMSAEASSESHQRDTDSQTRAYAMSHEHPIPEEDIQSLASDKDDMHSQVSVVTTTEAMAGKALVGLMLVGDAQFRSLSEKAIVRMGRQRFVENLRRLLKLFYKNLLAEAKDEGRKATARLLRSRRGRLRISNRIADHLEQDDEEDEEVFRISQADANRVESWLSVASNRDERQNTESGDGGSSSGSDDGLSPNPEDKEHTNIATLRTIILESRSFRLLLTDLSTVFLPIEIRQVLASIPKKHILLLGKQKVSLADTVKIWIEDTTQIRWNWWPLDPPMRMLQPEESRILWKCTCGALQWRNISDEQREIATKILNLSEDKPKSPYWCVKRKPRPSIMAHIKTSIQWLSPSQAARRYTPSVGSPQSSTSPSSGSIVSSTMATSSGAATSQAHLGHHITVPNQPGQTGSLGPRTSSTSSYILLGVQGSRRTLMPGQVHVSDQSTDSSVFQDLKKLYKSRRGFLRLYFSIWRLEYCHVVKFYRLALDQMFHDYKDLPTDGSYIYEPRAGTAAAKNPPLTKHAFQAMYSACKLPCDRISLFHDCITPASGNKMIARIPKRTKCFEHDQTQDIWGFEAVFAVSLAYVIAYHLALVAGPFVFWGWWLGQNPRDWQTASVPVTVALGGLSLFWSSSGILTERKEA